MSALFLARIVEIKRLKNKVSTSSLIKSLRQYKAVKLLDGSYQLVYIDDVLKMISMYYGIRLNEHFKSEKEILKLFKS